MTSSVARPSNLSLPFANSGVKNTIPVAASTQPGLASFTTGFPAATMQPEAAGGVPPTGQDFNGILYDVTSHTVFLNSGGMYRFDATLAANINGYPKGAVLQSNDGQSAWYNTVEGNTTDFNGNTSAGWLPFAGAALAAQLNGNVPINALIPLLASLPTLYTSQGSTFLKSGSLVSASGYPLARVTTNFAPVQISTVPGTNGGTNVVSSLTYQNSLFFALVSGLNGALYTSPDAVNWTARASSYFSNISGLAYGNSIFVATTSPIIAQSAQQYATSTDGINWTQRSLPLSGMGAASIAFGNGIFVMPCQNSTAPLYTSTLLTSTDGINWTTRSMPSAQVWSGIAFGNGVFVAVSSTAPSVCATSTDGINWTVRTTPFSSGSVAANISFAGSLFFSMMGSAVITSPDGVNWTTRTVPATGAVNYLAGQYYIGGYVSSDLNTWTAAPGAPTAQWVTGAGITVCSPDRESIVNINYAASGYVGLGYVVTPPSGGEYAWYTRIA
jgi:hypothetical protein